MAQPRSLDEKVIAFVAFLSPMLVLLLSVPAFNESVVPSDHRWINQMFLGIGIFLSIVALAGFAIAVGVLYRKRWAYHAIVVYQVINMIGFAFLFFYLGGLALFSFQRSDSVTDTLLKLEIIVGTIVNSASVLYQLFGPTSKNLS